MIDIKEMEAAARKMLIQKIKDKYGCSDAEAAACFDKIWEVSGKAADRAEAEYQKRLREEG